MINLPDMRHCSLCSSVCSLKTKGPGKIALDFNTLVKAPPSTNNTYFGLEKTGSAGSGYHPKMSPHRTGGNASLWPRMLPGLRVTFPLLAQDTLLPIHSSSLFCPFSVSSISLSPFFLWNNTTKFFPNFKTSPQEPIAPFSPFNFPIPVKNLQ